LAKFYCHKLKSAAALVRTDGANSVRTFAGPATHHGRKHGDLLFDGLRALRLFLAPLPLWNELERIHHWRVLAAERVCVVDSRGDDAGIELRAVLLFRAALE
jgi:hypothetical protein